LGLAPLARNVATLRSGQSAASFFGAPGGTDRAAENLERKTSRIAFPAEWTSSACDLFRRRGGAVASAAMGRGFSDKQGRIRRRGPPADGSGGAARVNPDPTMSLTSTDLLGTTFHAITTPPAYYAHNVLPVSALYLSTFFGSLKTLGVQPLIFTQTKSVNCALASGGYVNIGSMYALSSTSGVVAGGCSSSGNLSSSSVLPTAAQSIYLRLSGTVEVSGYAVGVIGTSATDASASFNSYISSEGSMASNYLSKSAFAPFLWVASFNDIKSFNHYIDLTSKKGKTLNVAGSSRSFSISGLCCATNSSSKINFTTAELVVQ